MDGRFVRSRGWPRFALLIAGMLVMYLRGPSFFHEPRFWAEEGSRNFVYAYSHGWRSIFSYNFGYFSIFERISALLAVHLVDLPDAPLVTTLLAFVVQTIPLVLILWSDSSPWDTLMGKVLGVSIVLFTSLTGEIWLNTVNSQFYFALVTFLILLEESSNVTRFKAGVHMFLLMVAGLTGAVSCFLTPLFAAKAWKERTRRSLAYLLLMAVCSLIQLIFLLSSDEPLASRYLGVQPRVILAVIWVKTIVLPLLGPVDSSRFANLVHHVRDLGDVPYGALAGLLLLTMAALWTALLWRACTYKRLLILGSYVTINVLSIIVSIGDKSEMIDAWNGQRYFYVPSVVLLISLFERIEASGSVYNRFVSVICSILIVISLTHGIVRYSSTLIMSDDWPKWREEVAKWEVDPEYALQIWPEGWYVRLMPRE